MCKLLQEMQILNLLDLSIDAMDVAGEQQFDVMHNMAKERLSKEGIPIKDDQEGTLVFSCCAGILYSIVPVTCYDGCV